MKTKFIFENPKYNYTEDMEISKKDCMQMVGMLVFLPEHETHEICTGVQFVDGNTRAIQLSHEQIETLIEALALAEAQLTELHTKASCHLYPSQQGAKSPLWAKACRFSDLASSIKDGGLDV